MKKYKVQITKALSDMEENYLYIAVLPIL